VSTTSEKTEVGTRLGREVELIEPTPPAVRVFDAGTGNGVVLSHVLRSLHRRMPTVPFFVVGKEASMEDGRLTLAQLPDRLAEHPNTVFVLTNMFYAEAPWLWPKDPAHQAAINWIDIPLQGSTSYDFFNQINELDETLADGWQTVTSAKSGNPVYQKPSVMCCTEPIKPLHCTMSSRRSPPAQSMSVTTSCWRRSRTAAALLPTSR
jgi:hypothetical protein